MTCIRIPVSWLFLSVFYSVSLCVSAGKWHLGVNCEHRGDHCHHPNQHGFSYFYGLPFTLFNDCVPGEGNDVLVDLRHTLRNLTILLGVGLFTLVWVIFLSLAFIFLSVEMMTKAKTKANKTKRKSCPEEK